MYFCDFSTLFTAIGMLIGSLQQIPIQKYFALNNTVVVNVA